MGVRKVKIKERAFVLRLPEDHATALEDLVNHGFAKSTNDLIVKIIASFLADMRRKAESAQR